MIRLSRRNFISVTLLLGASFGSRIAAAQNTLTFADAIAIMAESRSAAEGSVALLKRYQPKDFEARRLYAKAKATFDGVIGQLQADLASAKSPKLTPRFRQRLEDAAKHAHEFGTYADKVLNQTVPSGSKTVLRALIGELDKLITAIVNGGIAIFQEADRVGERDRKKMAERIEQERWRAFGDIEASK
jgi:hypothetical protein